MNLPSIPIGMMDRPVEAMSAAAQRPRSWWLPALLLLLSTSLLLWVSAPYAVPQANDRADQVLQSMAGRLSPEQLDQARQSRRPMTTTSYLLMGLGRAAVLGALGWVARGALAHFGSMAMGGSSTWGPTFATVAWSMLPFFVRDLLQTAYLLLRKQLIEHAGLSFLVASGDWLRDSRNMLYAALGRADLFVIWHLVLLALGLSIATKVSRGKAAVLAIIIWALVLAVSLIPVLLGRAFGGNTAG
jgi:hypothetical protein